MKTIIAALFIALIPMASKAETPVTEGDGIHVGEIGFFIPRPAGFVTVSSQRAPLKSRTEFSTPSFGASGIELLTLAPEADAPLILSGELYQSTRMLAVAAPRYAIDNLTSRSDLFKHKQMIRMLAADRDSERKQAKYLTEINKVFQERNTGFTLQSIVLLPPHHETERSVAYSRYFKFTQIDEQGNSVPVTSVTTTTLVHLKSKLLILNASSDEAGLEWSRQTSRRWADAIIEANPPDVRTMIRDSWPVEWSRVNWLKVFRTALLCILIVGCVGIAYRLTRRTKKRNQSDPQNAAADITDGEIV